MTATGTSAVGLANIWQNSFNRKSETTQKAKLRSCNKKLEKEKHEYNLQWQPWTVMMVLLKVCPKRVVKTMRNKTQNTRHIFQNIHILTFADLVVFYTVPSAAVIYHWSNFLPVCRWVKLPPSLYTPGFPQQFSLVFATALFVLKAPKCQI